MSLTASTTEIVGIVDNWNKTLATVIYRDGRRVEMPSDKAHSLAVFVEKENKTHDRFVRQQEKQQREIFLEGK